MTTLQKATLFLLLFIFTTVSATSLLTNTIAAAKKNEYAICHEQTQSKWIREHELEEHLEHGDTIGPCEGDELDFIDSRIKTRKMEINHDILYFGGETVPVEIDIKTDESMSKLKMVRFFTTEHNMLCRESDTARAESAWLAPSELQIIEDNKNNWIRVNYDMPISERFEPGKIKICFQGFDTHGFYTEYDAEVAIFDPLAPKVEFESEAVDDEIVLKLNVFDETLHDGSGGSGVVGYKLWSEAEEEPDWTVNVEYPVNKPYPTPTTLTKYYAKVIDGVGNQSELYELAIGNESVGVEYGIAYSDVAYVPKTAYQETTFFVQADITNTGNITWIQNKTDEIKNTDAFVQLSYHWYKLGDDSESSLYEWNGQRSVLGSPVNPGETLDDFQIRVHAPKEAGMYILKIDTVHEGVAWFSTKGNDMPAYEIEILGEEQHDEPEPDDLPPYPYQFGYGDTTFDFENAKAIVINGGGTNLRQYPDPFAPAIQKLPHQTPIKVLVESEGWYEVETTQEKTGWVSTLDVEMVEGQSVPTVQPFYVPQYTERFVCFVEELELFTEPSWNAKLLANVKGTTELGIIETGYRWSKVVLPDGTVGWMFNDYLCGADLSNAVAESFETVGFERPYNPEQTEPETYEIPITSEFGMRNGYLHTGTDYGMYCGTNILASASGKVTEVFRNGEVLGNESTRLTKGNYVKIKHTVAEADLEGAIKITEWETWYWHLGDIFVEPGDTVEQGELIAKSGNTGYVRGNENDPVDQQGCHLHFEVRFEESNLF